MEENIEVKDVQKTEYLDKNGLDMLWAKVKENTHNQVEVEYNRAKAKEDSLSQEIASVKPDEGKSYIQAKLISKEQDGDSCSYDVAGNISFKSEYSDSYSGPITQINKNGIHINFDNDPTFGSTGLLYVVKNNDYNITMQGNGRLQHDTKDTFNQVSISLLDNVDTTYANSSDGNSMLISQLGIFYTSQGYALTSNDLLTGHGSYKTIGTDIAPLENGKVPEKYLDLPQIDTTALKALEQKVTANTTAIEGKQDAGNYIKYERIIGDYGPDGRYLMHCGIHLDTYSGNSDVIIDKDGILVSKHNNSSEEFSTFRRDIIKTRDNRAEMHVTSDEIASYEIDKSEPSGLGDVNFQLRSNGVRLYGGDNNHVLTSNASTIDITEYAKKTDIPEVDTSDFVSKNADELQIINSPVALTSEVLIVSDTEDKNTDYVALEPTKLQFSKNNYTSSIELNGKDTDINTECGIEIKANHGNPLIMLYRGITGNGNDESALEITNSGISISNSQNENIGPDKVFATNGSIADLAQYVKKSEITADGNVDDVQVNGVSVVENKVANIKPATKEKLGVVKVGDGLNVTDGVISVSAGNYLTYDSMVNEQYYISSPLMGGTFRIQLQV